MLKRIIQRIMPKFLILDSRIKHQGIITVMVKNRYSGKINANRILINQITTLGLDELIKPLYAATPDLEIKELAFGDGSTTPSSSDESLVNETYRVSDTDLNKTNTGQVTSEFVLQGSEYLAVQPSGVINEIGFFAGSTAAVWGGGAGKDTGILVARLLWSYTLTASEDVYFQRNDILST